jgi:hypothetical protein
MKYRLSLIALLTALIFNGCSDDSGSYTCSSCDDEPEANGSYDGTGQGVYKGVLIGSTGTIRFNIANDGTYSATLVIDGKKYLLTTQATYNSEDGFFGTFVNANAGISIGLLVNTLGGADLGDITIPNHDNVTIQLFKELSTALVLGFEGTYSGDASGTFNMVVRQNDNGSGSLYVISRDSQGSATSFFEGQISSDGTVMGSSGEVNIDGIINGDNSSGTWVSHSEESGMWSGRRTL